MKKFVVVSAIIALSGLVMLVGSNIGQANGSTGKNVTFNKDVAKILYKNCVVCHRADDMAPMSLMSYKEARPWARSIKERVVKKEMPPWHADPKHGEFANDRRLTQDDINTIVAWVDQGAKEGDLKDLPKAPEFAEKWRSGKPDIILTMPNEYTLGAEGPDEYIYAKIPTNFTEDVWVQAVESIPGNRKIVHHIIAFVQGPHHNMNRSAFSPTKEMMEKMMAKLAFKEEGSLMRTKPDAPVFDNGCATAEGGAGIFLDGTGRDESTGMLGGEAPGSDVFAWPVGAAKKIPAGSTIILQMHYARNGKVEKDRSSVGLYLAKTPPTREMHTQMVVNYHFQIPPGADHHEVTACYTFKQDAHVYGVMPHMHLRGKDMQVTAYYPDGSSEVLINVPDYSFNWQTNYYLKTPKAMPKGTRLEVLAHFDNSTKNKFNPDPTKPVRFGDPTYDEMMIGFVDFTNDAQHLNFKTEAAGKAATAKNQ
ncbi:MAG: thiol-disulfide isomerase [Acidobacteria bacterium]|nr:thiol-disulfide isomerase [Acidobacteriota bacterium]